MYDSAHYSRFLALTKSNDKFNDLAKVLIGGVSSDPSRVNNHDAHVFPERGQRKINHQTKTILFLRLAGHSFNELARALTDKFSEVDFKLMEGREKLGLRVGHLLEVI
jgi:hypothetical protein